MKFINDILMQYPNMMYPNNYSEYQMLLDMRHFEVGRRFVRTAKSTTHLIKFVPYDALFTNKFIIILHARAY